MQGDANLLLNVSWLNGMPLRVTETYRSNRRQNELFAIGRDASGHRIPGQPFFTNARAGQSAHNFRKGMDVYPLDGNQIVRNGDDPRWQTLGNTGKAIGFEWGGDWTSPKDKPHFEQPGWRNE